MNTSKTLVFFGSGALAARSLENLAAHFDVRLVVTKSSPDYHREPAPVEITTKKLGLDIAFANSNIDLEKIFVNLNFHLSAGIVIDYGVIISKKIIEHFEYGIINSHFSLLPEWKGPDPITFSLLSGQHKTGVSLMLIDQKIDNGKLIVASEIEINKNDNNQSITNKLIDKSNELLNTFVPKYIDNQIEPYEQSNKIETFSRRLIKSDGLINTNKPATVIEREIKAYKGWPGSYMIQKNIRLTILKAKAVSKIMNKDVLMAEDGVLYLGCRIGSLEILEIKPEGKKNISGKSFINGYSHILN